MSNVKRHPSMAESVVALLKIVIRWAESRRDILALALVGSHARGTAHVASDVDLLFIVSDQASFRTDLSWLRDIQWHETGAEVAGWRDETYGVVWSRHVVLSSGPEVEFTFAGPSWASTAPMDPGTKRVVTDGWRVLRDPDGLLSNVAESAA
jgi:hypothetical protein